MRLVGRSSSGGGQSSGSGDLQRGYGWQRAEERRQRDGVWHFVIAWVWRAKAEDVLHVSLSPDVGNPEGSA